MSSLYNESLKTSFIDLYASKYGERHCKFLFKNTAGMERVLEKDVCNFILEEIISLLKSLRSTSEQSLRIKVSIYRTYTSYCIEHGMSKDGQNHFNEIDSQIIMGCIDKTKAQNRLLTNRDFMNIINDIPNARDQFILMAIYEGVCKKTAAALSEIQNHDLIGNNRIRTGRELVSVSEKLYSIAENAALTDTYYKGDGRTMKLCESSYLIKPTYFPNKPPKEKLDSRVIYRKLDNLSIAYKAPLTFVNVRLSGFMNKFTEIAEEQGGFLMGYYSEAYQKLTDRYGLHFSKLRLSQLYHDYKSIIQSSNKAASA